MRKLTESERLQDLRGASVHGRSARGASAAAPLQVRVRLGDPAWPSEASWDQLYHDVGDASSRCARRLRLRRRNARRRCEQLFKELKNPYYLGDEVGLQSRLGRRVDVGTERLRRRRQDDADVAAAVNFARTNNLRLVVRAVATAIKGHPTPPTRFSSGRGI